MLENGRHDLVSVVLPVYNVNSEYLYKCIESLLNQTYDELELIIIMDPSTNKGNDEDIISVIESFKDDHRLMFIRHKIRRGLVSSINEGIVLAKGEFIARADADDYYDIHKLEYQIIYLKNRQLDIVGSWAIIISNTGKVIGKVRLPVTFEEIRRNLIAHNPLINSSTVVARRVYRNIGLYTHKWEGSEDYEFWIRATVYNYRIGNIPRYLVFLRENPESITRGNKWLKNRLLYITLKAYALLKYPKIYLNARNVIYTMASISSIFVTPQMAIKTKGLLKHINVGYIFEPH